ncbi:hypothetical protein V6V16_18290, partial [Micromonospora sp. CPCC 205561]
MIPPTAGHLAVAATVLGAAVAPTRRPLAPGLRLAAPARRLRPAPAVDATARLAPAAVDAPAGTPTTLAPAALTSAALTSATLLCVATPATAGGAARSTAAGRPAAVDPRPATGRAGTTVDAAAGRAGPADGRR